MIQIGPRDPKIGGRIPFGHHVDREVARADRKQARVEHAVVRRAQSKAVALVIGTIVLLRDNMCCLDHPRHREIADSAHGPLTVQHAPAESLLAKPSLDRPHVNDEVVGEDSKIRLLVTVATSNGRHHL